jgi:hypothetical protein
MLAYVFWHTAAPSVSPAEYERSIAAFQESLMALRPPGYRRALVFRVEGAPWIGDGAVAYEERYLLDGSQSLDVLNWAAVSSACRETHDHIARQAAQGTAGLYRLAHGRGDLADVRVAAWFAKPHGWPYESLPARLMEPLAGTDAALWIRHMVLGPSPELCLQSSREATLPPGVDARVIRLHRVWPA